MESVLEANGSCKSLVMFFGMCLISFVLCPLTDMRDSISYGCYFYVKQANVNLVSLSLGPLSLQQISSINLGKGTTILCMLEDSLYRPVLYHFTLLLQNQVNLQKMDIEILATDT